MSEIKVLKPNEVKYTYAQSQELNCKTGYVGYLRGDFGSTGEEFYSTPFFECPQLRVAGKFDADLDSVINDLREDKKLLHSRRDMSDFVRKYPTSSFKGNYCTEYGFRVDTDSYAFLLRCNPTKGDYNFYCHCYIKEWLDEHIANAEQGIRFIDSNYNDLFRISDGEKIVIKDANGKEITRTCRYIDDYHTEIGNTYYHLCEFAERMENNGSTFKPVYAK